MAQSHEVTRDAPRAPRALPSILIALIMLVNGAASAAAQAAAVPSDHDAHHGHDGMIEGAPGDNSGITPDSDCCLQADCDCGCTAPHVVVQQIFAAPHGDFLSATGILENSAFHALRDNGTPFRPPA